MIDKTLDLRAQETPAALFRYAGRIALVVFGLAVFALGIVLTLQSGLGLGPWDILHQGLSRRLPITFGQANEGAGALVILAGLALGVRPGLATLLNMVLIGFFVDRILDTRLVPFVVPSGPLAQVVMDLVGVAVVGLGSGLYLRGGLGAGPRDGLMLGLHARFGGRLAVARTAIEIGVGVVGVLLGGTLGIGALIFAVGIGPAVEVSLRLCGVPTHEKRRRRDADGLLE